MSWLFVTPIWLVVLMVVVLLLLALEAGHRLGQITPIAHEQLATVSTPILAVVGLLLAFSFGMANERYAQRRAMLVQDANAIGTFYLRTSLVPEPMRSEMRVRVRRYVDAHFGHRAAGIDRARVAQQDAELDRLQKELWQLLEQWMAREPDARGLLLVTPALNQMIDAAESMRSAKENRLPDELLVYLIMLITVSGVVIGYRPSQEHRNWVLWGLLIFVLGGVLVLLLDMDRPRRGLIQTDTRPFERLRQSIEGD